MSMDAKKARGVLTAALTQLGSAFWQQPVVVQAMQAWARAVSSYGEVVVGGAVLQIHNWGLMPCVEGSLSCVVEDRTGQKVAVFGADEDGIVAWAKRLDTMPAVKQALASGETWRLAQSIATDVYGGLPPVMVAGIGEAIASEAANESFELQEPLYWRGSPGPQDDRQALLLLLRVVPEAKADLRSPVGLQGLMAAALAMTNYGRMDGQPTNNWWRLGTAYTGADCPAGSLLDQGQCLTIFGTPEEGIAAGVAFFDQNLALRAAFSSGDTGQLAHQLLLSGAYGDLGAVTQGDWYALAGALQEACNRLSSQPLGLGGFVWTADAPGGLIPTLGGPEELAPLPAPTASVELQEAGAGAAAALPEKPGPSGLKIFGIAAGMIALGYGATWAVDKSGVMKVDAPR
jgi:hypothetical protein